MDEFFAKYKYKHDPKYSFETSFRDLEEREGWDRESEHYRKARQRYLLAVFQEHPTPLNKFFILQYQGNLEYSYTSPPACEFDKLCVVKGWEAGTKPHNRAKRRFDKAAGALHIFFSQFPAFTYQGWRNPKAEFNRLAESRKWKAGSKRYNSMCKGFFEAFSEDFEGFFAQDGKVSWEALAKAVGMTPPLPPSITQCRKRLKCYNINIYDLYVYVRAMDLGEGKLKKFPNVKALADYTMKENLVYPSDRAKGKGAIRFLLRDLTS